MSLMINLVYFIVSCSDESHSSPSTVPIVTQVSENEAGDLLEFKGYVPSAFDVTVDGESYLDLEDFYTEELGRLPERVQEAGYPADFEIELDARIGFSDLWSDMAVYIVSENDRGFFGKSEVQEDGSFAIQLDALENHSTYKVRATKRIGIILSREGEQIQICYNFSAIDQSISFDAGQKPIILKDFVTKITGYACPSIQSDGLAVPTADETLSPDLKLKVGLHKKDILQAYGSYGLLLENQNNWCYGSEDGTKHRYCQQFENKSCQCRLVFDEESLLIEVENIEFEFLDDSML